VDQASLWLGVVISVVMLALITPGILRLNQGRVLRNGLIWLGIILILALVYHVFGPFGSATSQLPANNLPPAQQTETGMPSTAAPDENRPKLRDESDPSGL
jgi:hypothetical protein